MRQSRYTESQIVNVLNEVEAGREIVEAGIRYYDAGAWVVAMVYAGIAE